jgi:hypothetical protein
VALSTDTGFTDKNWSVSKPGLQFAHWAASSIVPQHRFQVRRFNSAKISDAEVDNILADASTVLQLRDPPEPPPVNPGDPPVEVACNVAFSRGDVIPFATGNGTIAGQADWNVISAVPGRVKVINQISWCATMKPAIGCAAPGDSLVVVRNLPGGASSLRTLRVSSGLTSSDTIKGLHCRQAQGTPPFRTL